MHPYPPYVDLRYNFEIYSIFHSCQIHSFIRTGARFDRRMACTCIAQSFSAACAVLIRRNLNRELGLQYMYECRLSYVLYHDHDLFRSV